MENVIKINQSQLLRIVESSLFKNPNYLNEGDNLLEFARKLYVIEYRKNGNPLSVQDQRDFFDNLIPKKTNLIREYKQRFDNRLITEDKKGIKHINNFFDFLKLNSIPLTEAPVQPKKPVAPANVNTIIQNLHKAFDGIGTDEDLAVKTIRMINTKDVLLKVDQTIKNTVGKKYPKIQNLAAWINDEMSDLDPTQYDQIWGHLTKMGYKGRESNKFLKAVGSAYQTVRKGWDWVKSSTIGKFFNQLRDALNSGPGMAAQLAVDAIGPETLGTLFAVPAAIWGLVVSWDQFNLALGTPEWLNIIFDTLCLVTTGILTNALAPIKMFSKGKAFSSIESVLKWLMGTKFGQVIAGWLPKLKGLVTKAVGYLTKAAEWFVAKFGKIVGETTAKSLQKAALAAKGTITSIVDRIVSFFGKQTAKAAAKTSAKSLSEKVVQRGMIGMKKMFGSPSWLTNKWVEKGAKAATVELVDKYAIGLSKDYSLEQIGKFVDKKYGTLYGDIFRFGIVAHDTTGTNTKLLASIHNFDQNDVNKMIKSVKSGSGALKSNVSNIGTEVQTGSQIFYDATKGIKAGVGKDPHQYKKVSDNEFYYALKTEKVPNWKKVTNPKSVTYLKQNLYGGVA